MLKSLIAKVLLILTILAVPAAAQEICTSTPQAPKASLLDRFRQLVAAKIPDRLPEVDYPETKEEKASRMESCKLMNSGKDDTPFSFWGHRHLEAHCKGWVTQLQQQTKSACCGGITSGECRLTAVNMKTMEVEIDGMWCPLKDAKKAVILGMDGAVALVCAGHTTETMREQGTCPQRYCYGLSEGD